MLRTFYSLRIELFLGLSQCHSHSILDPRDLRRDQIKVIRLGSLKTTPNDRRHLNDH